MCPRRTLEEVCTIYELEPDLRDLFVEGRGDKRFIEWFLAREGSGSAEVYTVDAVEVPDEVLLKYGLNTGSNRSRVLALAAELATRLPPGLRVLCVADRDFEDYLPSGIDQEYLLFTDWNSLELYAFTASSLEKFSAIALGGLSIPTPALLGLMGDILQQVYAIRLANELLGWGMEWLSFTKCVHVRGETAFFQRDSFVRAYLQKNNRARHERFFLTKVEEALGMLRPEAGFRIRGHDLAALLLHLSRKTCCTRKFNDATTLEGSLMAALEHSDLSGLPLFQQIADRVGS